MKVNLLNFTPLTVALEAALICTNSENKIDNYDNTEFLKKLVSKGHESVIEHINYNFRVEGVSRALLQELSRHRHISLSVQSTRWALNKITKNDHTFSENEISDLIDDDKNEILNNIKKTSDILKLQIENASEQGIPNDILKYYIQESLTTKLILTINSRELRHIFNLRTSSRALREFQILCETLYKELPYEHRFLYEEFFV